MPTSNRSDADTRAAIMRNARAALREQLRVEAVRRWGPMPDDQLDARVRELQRERSAAGGRKGAATIRARAATGRRFESMQADMVFQAEQALAAVAALLVLIRACAEDECWHVWPDDLDAPDASCELCGLLYAEWSLRVLAGVAA